MTISIINAFKAILSERYKKLNIICFALLFAIFSVFQIYFQISFQEISKNKTGDISTYILSFLFYSLCLIILNLLSSGYKAIIVNKEISHSKNVFPPIEKIATVLCLGLKQITAYFVWNLQITFLSFLIGLIIGIPIAIFIPYKPIGVLLIILIILPIIFTIIFKYLIPLQLMFYQDLKFSSLFAFRKTRQFLDKYGDKFSAYIFKLVLLGLILGILFLIIALIFGFLCSIITLMAKIPENTIVTITASLTLATITPFSLIALSNLDAQFINSKKCSKE